MTTTTSTLPIVGRFSLAQSFGFLGSMRHLAASTDEWKICYFHHPLYSDGGRHGSQVDLRVVLEPLFVKYDVNVVFSGHDHVYERIKPQDGVQYITEGSSGKIMRNNLVKGSPLTAYGNDQQQSFLLIQVTTKDLTVEAIGMDGKQFDTITLKRE